MTVGNVDVRVPVLESPGSLGGLVTAPAPKVLPDRPGVELAPGYSDAVAIKGRIDQVGKPEVKRTKLRTQVTCDGDAYYSCPAAGIKFRGAPKQGNKGRGVVIAIGSDIRIPAGDPQEIRLPLTGKAIKVFQHRKVTKRKNGHKHVIIKKGLKKLRAEVFIDGESAGFTTIKRTGKVG